MQTVEIVWQLSVTIFGSCSCASHISDGLGELQRVDVPKLLKELLTSPPWLWLLLLLLEGNTAISCCGILVMVVHWTLGLGRFKAMFNRCGNDCLLWLLNWQDMVVGIHLEWKCFEDSKIYLITESLFGLYYCNDILSNCWFEVSVHNFTYTLVIYIDQSFH